MSSIVTSDYFHIPMKTLLNKIEPDNPVQKYIFWLRSNASPILKIISVALPIITAIKLGALIGFPSLVLFTLSIPTILLGFSAGVEIGIKLNKTYTEELIIRAVGGDEAFRNLPILRVEENRSLLIFLNAPQYSTAPITKVIDRSGKTSLWIKVHRRQSKELINLYISYHINHINMIEKNSPTWKCERIEKNEFICENIFRYPIPFVIKDLIEGVDRNFELIPILVES
jgi:hypothetical protein